MRGLLAEAVQLMTTRWGTTTLAPMSMCASMALVGLPPQLAPQQPATPTDAKYVQVSGMGLYGVVVLKA